MRALVTADPAKRRAWKGVLLVLAVALAFVAAAQPQYGQGTRLIPATNLDVVIVLDYSKSMYARDVEPSRIFRAKVEVARLMQASSTARASAPWPSPASRWASRSRADGAAIAQFFRQLDPNDMPVGGTAIARALEQARELLRRDPKSQEHKRIILLVTDGEDLEGDPGAPPRSRSAPRGRRSTSCRSAGARRSRIPEVGADGKIARLPRNDAQGKPLTTALSRRGRGAARRRSPRRAGRQARPRREGHDRASTRSPPSSSSR